MGVATRRCLRATGEERDMVNHSNVRTPRDLQGLLDEAERLCNTRRGNLTPLRRQVLSMLLEMDRPAKAYDLLQRLKEDGGAKPPTIYRALDFLLEMGLVHRIESLQAFVPCGHWTHGHTAMFLICGSCGSVSELNGGESARKLGKEAQLVNFKPRATLIEVRGTCAACR
ncbi:Zinc uptake regulation protein [uncultured Defluviicoccus sp.]|uniref:Zinc uptake regulation protein n=1 Tax=metagenome TaxID=256318 RepID=A0A380T9H8_9ZZZZ|nr:Zinc uptake regulation protein [uncultured Defluviicoccus sp.]